MRGWPARRRRSASGTGRACPCGGAARRPGGAGGPAAARTAGGRAGPGRPVRRQRVVVRRVGAGKGLAGVEAEGHAPEGDLVAGADDDGADHPPPVDGGAVGGVEVPQHPQPALPAEFGMQPGHRLVAEPQPVDRVAAYAQRVRSRFREEQLRQALGLPGAAQPRGEPGHGLDGTEQPPRPAATAVRQVGGEGVQLLGVAGHQGEFHAPQERVVGQLPLHRALAQQLHRPLPLGVRQPPVGMGPGLEGRRHRGDCRLTRPKCPDEASGCCLIGA